MNLKQIKTFFYQYIYVYTHARDVMDIICFCITEIQISL